MNLIAQTVADGLVLGGIYALAAVGFSLIFGVLHVINLSHGIIVLMGAYLALIFYAAHRSAAHHAAGDGDPVRRGYVYQRFLIQYAVDSSAFGSILLTFGVALMMHNIMIWVFSPDMKNITPTYAFTSLKLGPIVLDAVRVSCLVASLVLLSCLAALLKFSPLGRVIRATAQQTLAARLCGVNVRHVYALHLRGVGGLRRRRGHRHRHHPAVLAGRRGDLDAERLRRRGAGRRRQPAGALIGGLLLGVVSTLPRSTSGRPSPT